MSTISDPALAAERPRGSITQLILGNVQSIQLPGQGRVYSNVGLTELLITFPDPEGDPVIAARRHRLPTISASHVTRTS